MHSHPLLTRSRQLEGTDVSKVPILLQTSKIERPRKHPESRLLDTAASFMHYDLGYFDLEQKTLQPIDNPFGTRLSPMS